MARLTGRNAEEVFRTFHDQVKEVFNRTITDCPLVLTARRGQTKALISFQQGQEAIAIPLSRNPLHLFFAHTVQAVKQSKRTWCLRTLAYAYRIQLGPATSDDWLFRFEYVAPEEKPVQHPRHHLHVSTKLEPKGCQALDCNRLHIPTGWVTFEELIRFLIIELDVKSKTEEWDSVLKESEEKFREWVGRDA